MRAQGEKGDQRKVLLVPYTKRLEGCLMGRPQQINHRAGYQIPASIDALPEHIIIDLHEIFLTKGMHYLTIETQNSGRKLVYNLLNSLNYYQSIGMLSLHAVQETSTLYDIHALLNECGYLDGEGNHDFDQFLLEALLFDIIIIEQTQELFQKKWFAPFLDSVTRSSLDAQLPIVVITYNA